MSTLAEKGTVPTSQVVPENRFIGTVQVDLLEARVTALACLRSGEIVLLTMTGPRTTVSAIAAALHKGGKNPKSAQFTASPGEQWDGPEKLFRMDGLGSGWITSPVEPTTQLEVAILAHGANIGQCCQCPLPQPHRPEAPPMHSEQERPRRPSSAPRYPLPPLRFLLANEGAEHPDWMALTGLMRTFWLPFPPLLCASHLGGGSEHAVRTGRR
jgi:hypothetical protein